MIKNVTFASLLGYEIPSTNRKKKCKFRGCKTVLNRYQAVISNYCCVHEKVMSLRRLDAMAEKIGRNKKKVKEHSCTNCICFYSNQKKGSETYEAMEEAQIECSLEQPHTATNNEARECEYWQETE